MYMVVYDTAGPSNVNTDDSDVPTTDDTVTYVDMRGPFMEVGRQSRDVLDNHPVVKQIAKPPTDAVGDEKDDPKQSPSNVMRFPPLLTALEV